MSLPLRQYLAPKVIKPRKKARRIKAIRCRAHVAWVLENFRCALAGKVNKRTGKLHECEGRLDPHHTPTRGAGGGDNNVVPLCRKAHTLIDSPGNSEKSVEQEYDVEFRPMGDDLWDISPHGKKYRLEHQ